MTTIFQQRLPIPAAEMNGESTLPLLYDIRKPAEASDSDLSENDGLFLGYGGMRTAFPYKAQDCYGQELTRDGLDGIILENDHLRATFVPSLGGKLWSLFDKNAGKELLFANPVFRPAYLALRNAWASGGVEWNCGAVIGHHPYTCSQMFTAILSAEESGLGCPVLRMYHYERIQAVTYQMDFYLPEGAKFLHCRMRVVNDAYTATAMYWWSNIAVPSDETARNVVPADEAYTHKAGGVTKVPVPVYNEIDVTYPTRNPIAVDYFYKTYEDQQHYTTHLNAEGYGLVQTSTSRLKGRKLFVWGRGQGGAKWQEYLAGEYGDGQYSDGRYCEIQCGLANTQYECLPMPPKTAWEWIEYYGPLQADPAKIHGSWKEAQEAVQARLDTEAPLSAMETELVQTHKMATTSAKQMLSYGDGWAALENYRRAGRGMQPLCPHLDFGSITENRPSEVFFAEQQPWKGLLDTGTLRSVGKVDSSVPPLSYQRRTEWVKLMQEAAKGADKHFWMTHYMLGCAWLASGDLDRAENALNTSCALEANAWNTYAMAELYRILGQEEQSARTMLSAFRMAPGDDSLCKRTAKALTTAKLWDTLAVFTDSLTLRQKQLPRIRLYLAVCAEKRGQLELAEQILTENDGLEVPDIQEGEISITQLWFDIMEKKAARDGVPFDRSTAKPPKKFDFRMNVSE